jgi:hypothetical protein
MAGRNSGFNPRKFRDGIRFAYDMGAPPLPSEQAIFFKPSQLVYDSAVDADDVPFDPQDLPVRREQPVPIRVPCAVEYFDAQGQIMEFGMAVPARAVITLLDEDYVKIKGCAYVMLRGEKFNYASTTFPNGLFDVGLYTLSFTAENAS